MNKNREKVTSIPLVQSEPVTPRFQVLLDSIYSNAAIIVQAVDAGSLELKYGRVVDGVLYLPNNEDPDKATAWTAIGSNRYYGSLNSEPGKLPSLESTRDSGNRTLTEVEGLKKMLEEFVKTKGLR